MGDKKIQIQNASSTTVYIIHNSPGGGTPIMIFRQFVYVAR